LNTCFLAFAAETEMARTFKSESFQDRLRRTVREESFRNLPNSEKAIKIKSFSQKAVRNSYVKILSDFVASPILGSKQNNRFACQLITGDFLQKQDSTSCKQELYAKNDSSSGDLTSAD